MLNLLTCTGCRPEAWKICQFLMMRQTYAGPVRWVIVDDGEEPQEITFKRDGWELIVVRPEPFWKPGKNTQHRNMLAGLEHIPRGDAIAFIEDDDYYTADWLDIVMEKLKTHDLIGMTPNRYYNVRSGQVHNCCNTAHSSLCSSALKGKENYDILVTQTKTGRKLIDIQLWKHCQNRKTFYGMQVIGMKAMPGRAGIAGGHVMPARPKMSISEWIGDDAKLYEGFLEV